MRQCIFVIGTRAQLVKIAPVLREASTTGLQHVVWFTSQHHESIDDLIADFDLKPSFVRPPVNKERSSITGLLKWLPATLIRCWRFIRDAKKADGQAPLVVVHGDTLSTVLGAFAARLAGAPVVHLESGLSSGRLFEPFPEEAFRRLTFRLSRYALCPNDEAFARMQRMSGVEAVHTGENTLLDCVRFATRESRPRDAPADYFVASIHRFQNIYRRLALASIVNELLFLAAENRLYFVLHPSTLKRLQRYGLFDDLSDNPNVILRPRMPYTEFLALMAGARCVFSDGGSNQEELSYLGVPTVLFRERSERPDGLGENIVFRHDIDGSLAEYCGGGGFDALRRAPRMQDSAEPSRHSVEALLKWARVVD